MKDLGVDVLKSRETDELKSIKCVEVDDGSNEWEELESGSDDTNLRGDEGGG